MERIARGAQGLGAALTLAALFSGQAQPARAQTPAGVDRNSVARAEEGRDRVNDEVHEIIPPKPGTTPGGPALDRSTAVVPAADPCEKEAIDLAARTITITNGCASVVTLQYMTSQARGLVRQFDLEPGYGLRAPYFGGRDGSWWIWTACPQGFFSTVKLNEANRAAISSGAYRCTRP